MQPVRADTAEAHTIDVVEGTGKRRFSRFFAHLGHCPVTAAVFHLLILLCHRAGRAKHARAFEQRSVRSVGISDRSVADRQAENSETSLTRPVGEKASFPFRSSASEEQAKRPIEAVHWGIRVRQTPKALRVRRSFGRAGETKFALKWGGRTDQARNENRHAWTNEGRVDL